MPWSLEIHHIDLTTRGDATLIIARETPPFAGAVGLVRSLLIDGGLPNAAPRVDAYLALHLGPAPLDAMVATHYEIDHVGGLINLLRMPATPRYANTRIYDQGWEDGGLSNLYLRYLYAINGRNGGGGAIAGMALGARRRLTRDVNCTPAPTVVALFTVLNLGPPATPIVGTSAVLQAAINQPPNALLGVEILWDGRPVAGPTGMAPPMGAPTVTCIAANQYALGHFGLIGGIGVDVANDRSLAFIVEFNGFRYYIGGDITNPIEAVIAGQLNVADDGAGRVTAIKTSHHGSNTATSRAFVSRLRPDAAFISCGTANPIVGGHPAQQTVNVLDGYADTLVGAHPASPPTPPILAGPIPPEPPNRPVDYFLTGYQVVAPAPPAVLPQSRGGDTSFTAGDPRAASYQPGHVVVTVSGAQSLQDRRSADYGNVSLAVYSAAIHAGVPHANANAAATAAAEAVLTHYGPGEAARQAALQLIPLAAVGRAAVVAAVYDAALQQYYAAAAPAAAAAATVAAATGTAMAAAVAAAAPAPPVAAAVAAAIVAVTAGAAAAGAAVGAYQGHSAPLSLSASVDSALAGAGFPVLAAAAVALLDAVVAAPGPGLFDVTYWDLNAGPVGALVAENFS